MDEEVNKHVLSNCCFLPITHALIVRPDIGFAVFGALVMQDLEKENQYYC